MTNHTPNLNKFARSNLSGLSNRDLIRLCRRYGEEVMKWRRKFAGLLPEVNRRRLYEKKGYASIFEFGARLGGFSVEQIRRVLNLDRALENLPILRGLLVCGEVSSNKLAKIVSVTCAENEKFWAKQVQILSCRALETLVRDMKVVNSREVSEEGCGFWDGSECKNKNDSEGDNVFAVNPGEGFQNQDGLFKINNANKSVHVNTEIKEKYNYVNMPDKEIDKEKRCPESAREGDSDGEREYFKNTKRKSSRSVAELVTLLNSLELDEDILEQLMDLKKKGLDVNNILRTLLARRREEIAAEKARIGDKLEMKSYQKVMSGRGNVLEHERAEENSTLVYGGKINLYGDSEQSGGGSPSRYIPVAVRRVLNEEYGTKCSIPHCTRRAHDLHHTRRFALSAVHDPRYIAPLCEEHHKLAHQVDAGVTAMANKGL